MSIFQLLIQICATSEPSFRSVSISSVPSYTAQYTITPGDAANTSYGLIYQSGLLACPTGPMTLPVSYWTTNPASPISTNAVGSSLLISTTIAKTLTELVYTVCANANIGS